MIILPKAFPILNTKRLILKEYDSSYISQMAQLANDKDISNNLASLPYPFLEENAKKFISDVKKRYDDKDLISFAIIEKESSNYIGNINLDLCEFHNHVTLGYWIGKAYWGKGYMVETLKIVMDFSFNQLKVYRVTANHFHTNKASAKVLEKAGMKLEGIRRGHFKKNKSYLDIYDWGILHDEFKKQG